MFVQKTHLSDDGGKAGVVESFVVRIRLLISLPVLQLHLQSFVHPLRYTLLQTHKKKERRKSMWCFPKVFIGLELSYFVTLHWTLWDNIATEKSILYFQLLLLKSRHAWTYLLQHRLLKRVTHILLLLLRIDNKLSRPRKNKTKNI